MPAKRYGEGSGQEAGEQYGPRREATAKAPSRASGMPPARRYGQGEQHGQAVAENEP